MAPTPGLLYVTMQPKPPLTAQQFHDWYNNEHGPTRLRLPYIATGFRYRATDLSVQPSDSAKLPEWLAWYDITDMAELTEETYTRLREPGNKSQRETDTMAQIHVNRKLFDFVREWKSPSYHPLEDPTTPGDKGSVLISVTIILKPGENNIRELDKWYNEEHVDLLSKVPGWLRSRRYVTSTITPAAEKGDTEYMALHEYAPTNGIGGKEFVTATSTPWAKKILEDIQASRARRVYGLYYTFGPAPRELDISTSWTAPDKSVVTTPASISSTSSASWAAIESTVTTSSGITIPYRLEGSSNPHAPLLLLSNSILVTYSIWDSFISLFLARHPHYRILRYNTRGRSALSPIHSSIFSSSSSSTTPERVTLDLLSADVIDLLNALRVPRAACLIGVSLGGATVLNTALKHPSRVSCFIACDTNALAPASNKQAWSERIQIAEQEGAEDPATGEAIVGDKLAEATVGRWFAVSEDNKKEDLGAEMERVRGFVRENSLDGFRRGVKALFEYDLREEMKGADAESVRGCFVAGGQDGKLPEGMREMSALYGSGSGKSGRGEFEVVEDAGHLPMVEKPEVFVGVVERFLERGK